MRERLERQAGIVPAEELEKYVPCVAGVGAIGRQVAIQLALIGTPKIKIYDFDDVEEVNLGPQGYCADDVGIPKVEATKDFIQVLDPEVEISAFHCPMNLRGLTKVLFLCVDDMGARANLFETHMAVKGGVFMVDARMAAESVQILTVIQDADSIEYYRSTLFPGNEAVEQSCTAKSTIYTANIAAGMMVAAYTQWLRGAEPKRHLMMNIADSMLLDGSKQIEW
jgi:molybdopterin/thiamine biosynthesis adenylyltransferase